MAKQFSIYTTVTGCFRQDITLNDDCDLSPQDFIEKLNKGEISTSIAHGFIDSTQVFDNKTLKAIGQVAQQEALDDVETKEHELAYGN